MFSYFKNFMPGKKVNDIPLAAVYKGFGKRQDGIISVNLKTGTVYYGGIVQSETKVNPIISGIWTFLKAKKKIPENIQNAVRKPETNPFRKSIVEYITTTRRLIPDVDLAPEDSKRWQDWLILLDSNNEEFFSDKPELKPAFENKINASGINASEINASEINASGISGGRKRKGRKSRGRKSRGRKSRGRKSRGRKSRGRKSRRRKSRRRKSRRRKKDY